MNTAGRRTKAFKGHGSLNEGAGTSRAKIAEQVRNLQMRPPPGPASRRSMFSTSSPEKTAGGRRKSAPKKAKQTRPRAKRPPVDKQNPGELNKTRAQLNKLFREKGLPHANEVLQALEILDQYVKKHLLDGEPVFLREILRLVHKMLPKGPQKSKIRGILCKL